MPAPDLVVIMLPWGSHDKVNRGREYATALNIPILDAAGTKSDMVKRAEDLGLDISGIFEKKVKPEQKKSHKCRRIEGDLRDFILAQAHSFRFGYPLKTVDALQLKEIVMMEKETEVEAVQIQRCVRIAYKSGKYPPKSSTREIPITPDPGLTTVEAEAPANELSAPPLIPAPVLPTSPIAKEDFCITGSVEAIFKKLFEMHDRILSLIDERNMFAEEVAHLSADNKLLKEKTDKLANIETLLKTLQLK
jgi:post-segregation antitoxin (ccd killing protein)